MDLKNLDKILINEPKYRQKQINNLLFKDLINDWQEASVLPLVLRETLNQECPLNIEGKIFSSKSSYTTKALLTLVDGSQTETVLLKHSDGRRTVCVSCQLGCPMGCRFCATGQMGFKRNLTAWEIVEQILFWARKLKVKGEKITNIVYMGMGEPFMNYANVLNSVRLLNDADKFGLGARHISISTCGLVEGINKLSNENLQVNLAVSLHAATNELRSEIMPINKKYPLDKVLASVKKYVQKTSRRVMFEYVLLKGVNDSIKHAEDLAKIMAKPLYLVNIISYNPTGKFKATDKNKVEDFINVLKSRGVAVTQRYTFGTDILAACGQLANKVK